MAFLALRDDSDEKTVDVPTKMREELETDIK
jgi:hypothetical protein